MKPPKNFYSNLDRRKQGLPEVPEASAADAGKVIKVGSDGSYELGEDAGTVLPSVSDSDNFKTIQVKNGNYSLTTAMSLRSLMCIGTDRSISSTQYPGIRINQTAEGINQVYLFASSAFLESVTIAAGGCSLTIGIQMNNGDRYSGFTLASTSSTLKAFVINRDDNVPYIATITTSSITFEPWGSVKYYEITASGSSVSLPSGVTFADVYAELQAGVDVKFTSGARVYSVTSFESTNIRAHWMSDLDLTSMEVYVINIASDGTGTVASATFSGS